MKPTLHIVDTTMRDGEQSPGIAMTKEQKLHIASVLDAAGIYQIEAGIPAMSHYEIDTIGQIAAQCKNSKVSVWSRLKLSDLQKCIQCKPDIIHICAPVSYVQIYSKLGKNKSWIIKNLTACVEYARGQGYEVTVGFEDASRADITFMAALAKQLQELGVTRIRYSDTVGILSPARAYQAAKEIIGYAGVEVEVHAHNDLGMAVANSIMGAKAGARFIDTTIGGIGERAGNCDYYKFIHAAQAVFRLNTTSLDAMVVEETIDEIIHK